MLTIRKELREYHDGRAYIRYTPILTSDSPTFSGELHFAYYECGDGSTCHEHTIDMAKRNAYDVLRKIGEQAAKLRGPLAD